jgi:hypothetical protein
MRVFLKVVEVNGHAGCQVNDFSFIQAIIHRHSLSHQIEARPLTRDPGCCPTNHSIRLVLKSRSTTAGSNEAESDWVSETTELSSSTTKADLLHHLPIPTTTTTTSFITIYICNAFQLPQRSLQLSREFAMGVSAPIQTATPLRSALINPKSSDQQLHRFLAQRSTTHSHIHCYTQ